MEETSIVPIIDMSTLFGDDTTAKKHVAKQIDTACRDSGFFYVSNHGIDLNELYEKTFKFHQRMTDEEKWSLAIAAWNSKNTKQIRNGYQPSVKGKKAVEMFCYLNPEFNEDHPNIKRNIPMHEVNVWPEKQMHPGFKEFNESYYNAIFDVTAALLRGFALALGKEEHFFDTYFKKFDTLSSVVLIHYPYLEEYPPVLKADDGTELAFGKHQDVDLITVLAQTEVQNLQVEMPTGSGVYKDVPPNEQHFLVNVGGYMDHLTNGYYRAVWHRVRHINRQRLSIPFFANLGYHDTVEPFTPHSEDKERNNQGYVQQDCGNLPLSYGDYLYKGLFRLIRNNGQR